MMEGSSSTIISRPDEAAIRDALDFLLHDTGDRILKSEESLAHLANLEAASDTGGVSATQFSLLVRIAAAKQMPARLLQRFLSTLVPSEPVKGDDLRELCLWALGDGNVPLISGAVPALRAVELCLEHDLVRGRRLLAHIYELFLSALTNKELVASVAAILIAITTNTEVTERRVRLVRQVNDLFGNTYELNTLRWLIRQLRPDLEPNCPRPPSSRPARNTLLHRRFRRASAAITDSTEVPLPLTEGLGWEAGQLAGAIVFKDGRRECPLPSAETINLQSGLESQLHSSRRSVASLANSRELRDHLETAMLPNNILALLGCRGSVNILARKEVVERFSLNLYHCLKKELMFVPSRQGRLEALVRERRQARLLGLVNRFQEKCFQGLPVIGRFLTEYLLDWNGRDHFSHVIEFIRFLQITDFQELYCTVLSPIEEHFHSYSVVEQLIVFVNVTSLLRFWSSVEYRRFNLKKSGLFPDNTFNCGSAFNAVEALGCHLAELAVRMLHTARTDPNYRKDTHRYIMVNSVIRALKQSQELMVEYRVPVKLNIPLSLVHEAIFSHSALLITQVCEFLVYQKRTVIPFIRQSARDHESRGEDEVANQIRSQLSAEQLTNIELVTTEMLHIFSTTGPAITPGSIFSQGWRLPEQLLESGLHVVNHPAFLPYLLRHLDGLRLSNAERQDFWRGAERSLELASLPLQDDRPGRGGGGVPSHQFYRGHGQYMSSVQLSEDMDMLYRYLGDLLPAIGDFLNTFFFRATPALSITSQHTELTESSGVSSFLPRSVVKSRQVRQPKLSSLRQENLAVNSKRKSFEEPEASRHSRKRQILKEHN